MKLINQSFEIIMQEDGLKGIFRQIERAARVSYKSEDKITEDSAEKFVREVLIKRGHLAPLEHGTVYLTVPYDYYNENPNIKKLSEFYYNNPYSDVKSTLYLKEGYPRHKQIYYITTNYRVLWENERFSDLKYYTPPKKDHSLRVSVKLITSRSITHELVRHRIFSFVQESTRFCNYSQGRFNSEITCIRPEWLTAEEEKEYINDLSEMERMYFKHLDKGWKPQHARELLLNALKSEIFMTGFLRDWIGKYDLYQKGNGLLYCSIPGNTPDKEIKELSDKFIIVKSGIFPQRCAPEAHPMMQALMKQVRQAFIDKGLMEYVDL